MISMGCLEFPIKIASGMTICRLCRCFRGEQDREQGSLAELAFHDYLSAMFFDNPLCYCQSQTYSGLLCSEIGLENLQSVLFCESLSLVCKRQSELLRFPVITCPQRYFASKRHGLRGICDEIEQAVAQQLRVSLHEREVGSKFRHHLYALFGKLVLEERKRLGDEIGIAEAANAEFQRPAVI